MVQLVGPGGAGKTTIGAALAERLGVPFVDLDAAFTARYGDISTCLASHGYEAYAEWNLGLYLDLVRGSVSTDVLALSSGFMTYRDHVHPDYLTVRPRIASSPSTFVLLPSPDMETCVEETVRRQLRRPFARSAERERQVIRKRFPVYVELRARKIFTMRPVDTVATELVAALAALEAGAPA